MSTLGRLTRVGAIRDVWPDEARDFTPWLAAPENIALLSEALGLGADGLEVEGVEQQVGPFRADILCRKTDSAESERVLVENMFGRTDHDHLGKLVTYGAGLEARIVVLIAEDIRPEHRAALDWLNRLSDDEHSFFAVTVDLWRIGDSLPAPRFNVIVAPNDWARSVTTARRAIEDASLSPAKTMQIQYWTEIAEAVAAKDGPLKAVSPGAWSFLTYGIGRSGFTVNMAMNTRENWVRVELYLGGPKAKAHFHALAASRNEIEQAFGAPLEWQELPGRQDSRICYFLHDADPFDEDDRPRQISWLVENATAFHRVFAPFVRALPKTFESEAQ